MPKGPEGQNRPADGVARAVMIAKIATGEEVDSPKMTNVDKQRLGGKARAGALSKERRSKIAKKAAEARWNDN